MKYLINELINQLNVRSNLSELRKAIKNPQKMEEAQRLLYDEKELLEGFLSDADPKIRKNAALLIGDLEWQDSLDALYQAYQAEDTRFVKSSYLQAMQRLEVDDLLPDLKQRIEVLRETRLDDDNRKHVEEEVRELQKLIIGCEGIQKHKFSPLDKKLTVLLVTNKNLRENVAKSINDRLTTAKAKTHPLGVLVETDHFTAVSKIRTYRELLFPVPGCNMLPGVPAKGAELLWSSGLYQLLCDLHTEGGTFYYRLEVKDQMDLEKRSEFARKFTAALDQCSRGKLVNTTSDYEVEIRLMGTREGNYFPCIRLYTYKDTRFAYRRNAIATSMHPATAALIAELAKPYLKENAQIMDPFCGVGTLLIERNHLVAAREMYATDVFGDAITLGRENAAAAKAHINFIHRDFFDFHHEYTFDEVITDLPMRGKKTREEMDAFYSSFFEKLPEILSPEAIIILYTNEAGFVKKQLRLHKEYELLQETNMQKATQTKQGFDLFIIRAVKA